MVAIKKLLILGLGILSSAPFGSSASAKDDSSNSLNFLEGRDPPCAQLQWSPDNRFLITLALRLPRAFNDIFAVSNINIAKQVVYEFKQWCLNNVPEAYFFLDFPSNIGGVYDNQDGGGITFGVGLQTLTYIGNIDAGTTQDIINAFTGWGQQDGGVVHVIQRPNRFFNPATSGLGNKRRRGDSALEERTQTNFCPSQSENILQYMTSDDMDTDDIRMVALC